MDVHSVPFTRFSFMVADRLMPECTSGDPLTGDLFTVTDALISLVRPDLVYFHQDSHSQGEP